MPLKRGTESYLRKLARDRERKRLRNGRKLRSDEQRWPRKRVDPPELGARAYELMTLMRAWRRPNL